MVSPKRGYSETSILGYGHYGKMMRRLMLIVLANLSSLGCIAADFFNVVSPKMGQTVRETFAVSIPRHTIRSNQYVGFWVSGRFLLATGPVIKGNNYIYFIDSKANKLPDGKLKLEVVLYSDDPKAAKALMKVIRLLHVDNHTSIKVPKEGLLLRYRFRSAQQLVYSAREYLRPEQSEPKLMMPTGQFRILLTTQNVLYSDGGIEAVIRNQLLNRSGKKSFTLTDATASQKSAEHSQEDVVPFYMLLNSRGVEKYGSVAPAVSSLGRGAIRQKIIEDQAAGGKGKKEKYLEVGYHLPVLPEKPLTVGGTGVGFLPVHVGRFGVLLRQQGKIYDKTSFVFPAKVILKGVEWEQGRRCAKLQYELALSSEALKKIPESLKSILPDTWRDTYWFDIERGVLVKMERMQKGKGTLLGLPAPSAMIAALQPSGQPSPEAKPAGATPPRPGGTPEEGEEATTPQALSIEVGDKLVYRMHLVLREVL
jgi:hypothetical protein